MVVHKRLETLAGMDLGELSLCHFHQCLKEVLKVHIRLVTIYGAEDQIQSLFHLFIGGIHALCGTIIRLLLCRLAINPCIFHNLVIFLRLYGVNSHPISNECVRVKHAT